MPGAPTGGAAQAVGALGLERLRAGAGRAAGPAAHQHQPAAAGARLVDQQPPGVGAALAGQQPERLGAHQPAGEAGQRADDAGLGAGGDLARRRRRLEEAAHAAGEAGHHREHLQRGAEHAAVDQRLAGPEGGVAGEELGREVVRAVDQHVDRGGQLDRLGGVEAARQGRHLQPGVERLQPGRGGGGLGLARGRPR